MLTSSMPDAGRDGDRLGGEPRASIPQDVDPQHRSASCSTRSTRPASATSSARGSSAAPDGSTEIYISHRGMDEVLHQPQRPGRQTDVAAAPARSRARGRVPAPADGASSACRGAARAQPRSPRAGSRAERATLVDRGAAAPATLDVERAVRPRLAPRRPGARPRRLHRRGPRPLQGHLLRALRRSAKDGGDEVERRLPRRSSRSGAAPTSPTKAEQYRVDRARQAATRAQVQVLNKDGAPDTGAARSASSRCSTTS